MPRSFASLWVTVGVTTKDEGKCLYAGFDFAAAQAALNSAGTEFDSVGILPHGIAPMKMRRPSSTIPQPAVAAAPAAKTTKTPAAKTK